jgi:hypothetical protein
MKLSVAPFLRVLVMSLSSVPQIKMMSLKQILIGVITPLITISTQQMEPKIQ